MGGTPDVPSRPSGGWRALLEPAIRHGGWFAVFLMLAPIVGPRGYGLFVMALSGIAIIEAVLAETVAAVLTDTGARDDCCLSTALVSAVGIGAVISLMLFVAAGQLDAMLDEAALGDIFQSLSLLPVLGALSAVPMALLRRRGKHGPFVAVTSAGLAAGGGVAVALAWAGAGPWSLVAQIVVQRFVECAVLWTLAGRRIGLIWSPTQFARLFGAIGPRALVRVWPVVTRQTPCLLIGLALGPTACGLYMLAGRFAEALGDVLLAAPKPARRALLSSWAEDIAFQAERVLLPAVLASTLLAIAMPPLVDIRWWGAVLPARILLLGVIPAAIISAREAAVGSSNEARWQAVQALGGIAAVALAVPYGLTAVAAASLAFAIAAALLSLIPIRRQLGPGWHRTLAVAARPAAGAAAVGFLLYQLTEPVSLAVAAVSALCLLGALGWLCYLLLRGERSVPQTAPAPLGRGLGSANPA